MSYRFLEHTGELGLEVEAPSLEELLNEAARAFAELTAAGQSGEAAVRSIELKTEDERTLFADWLNELVFLADTDGFVPERLLFLERKGVSLRAAIEGFQGAPRPIVKAVTYHDLELKEDLREGWKARVVLDV